VADNTAAEEHNKPVHPGARPPVAGLKEAREVLGEV